MYCLVTWLAHDGDANRAEARAHVQCGEDTVRDYQVHFDLRDDTLRMRWSAEFTMRPLQRCE